MRATSLRKRAGWAGNESGVAMMFVIMATLLIGTITVTVMQIIAADVTGGVRELQADQVRNIAQAGAHYAIGKLQVSGAGTYTGETLTVADGSTTLGTATITVSCIDTGGSPSPTPCSGTYAAYRRIVSTGSLPLLGPTRKVVAVVQGTSSGGGSWSTAVCALSSVSNFTNGGDTTTINGDIVSNGSISLTPSSATVKILGDPGTPKKYTGKVSAVGTVTCGAGCSAAGGLFGSQAGPLCSAPTLPTFAPGASNVTVAASTTYTINSPYSSSCTAACSFNNITVSDGTCSGATPFTTLVIQTDPSDPTATTVVQLNTLNIGLCGRLMIAGVGKVDLRIGAATGESLTTDVTAAPSPVHFGVGPTDTLSTPAPIAASRLIVWVNSNGSGSGDCHTDMLCAAWISHSSGGATIIVPNGTVQIDDSAMPNPLYGAVMGKEVKLSGNGIFTSDTSGLSGFSTTYSNFNVLKSWKDQ